jgi:uncharacterized protein YndB with AHSA1/START domain
MIEFATAPVKKTIYVEAPVDRAFEVFTDGIASWWPLDTHSNFGDERNTVVFERGIGGRIFEQTADGEISEWATVTGWDPPHGFVVSWQPNRERPAPTEVEVRFTPSGSGTMLELEHRCWERLGEEAAESRASYNEGWDPTLEAYAKAVAG